MDICISENLCLLRQKTGYTQESLAEIISVSRQSIAKWESGDSLPDIMNCTKLASLFKISLDELVYKPLKSVLSSDFSENNGRIGGVVDVSSDGTIKIPDAVMEMFSIHPGEKVLLLADKNQGIALIKCSQF